tara:strand:- start:62 stop:745 length:684 start_codon:yes stop_codon:yes gene_type:complete
MKCLFCGNKPVTKKCSNCKIAWFCSKECQTNGWKHHKKTCVKDEYLIWSYTEKIQFFDNINNLQKSYQNKVLNALNTYNLANNYLNKLLDIQKSYVKEDYEKHINVTIVYFRDSEIEWRLLKVHIKEMLECYNNKDDDWSLALIAFYEQFNEETTKFRTLICLSIAHCYFSLKLLYKDKDINDRFYKECKNNYELALLFKSNLKSVDYIETINNFMLKLEKIKRFIQ